VILEGTVDIYHTQQHGTSKICGICLEVFQLVFTHHSGKHFHFQVHNMKKA